MKAKDPSIWIQNETLTSREEGTDHEAEADGGHSEKQQEEKDQRGITIGQHGPIRTHLKWQIQ